MLLKSIWLVTEKAARNLIDMNKYEAKKFADEHKHTIRVPFCRFAKTERNCMILFGCFAKLSLVTANGSRIKYLS